MFDFDGPEHGSEGRFRADSSLLSGVVPWFAHRGWWIVHNCIVHPLIGVLPRPICFHWHDWTSEKMHAAAKRKGT